MEVALTDVFRRGQLLNIHAPAAALPVVGPHHQEGEHALVFAGDHGQRLPSVDQTGHKGLDLAEPTLQEKALEMGEENAMLTRR